MLAVVHYTRRCAKNALLTLPFFGLFLLVSPCPPELQKAQMIFPTQLALQQPLKLLLESLCSSCTTNKERDDIGSSVIIVFNVYSQKITVSQVTIYRASSLKLLLFTLSYIILPTPNLSKCKQ